VTVEPEYEAINAVVHARTAVGDVLRPVLEKRPESVEEFVSFWAASGEALVEANISVVDAAIALVDWWREHPTRASADTERVYKATSSEELRRAVNDLDRDRLAAAYEYHRQAARELVELAGRADLASIADTEDTARLIEDTNIHKNPTLKKILDKATNFGDYVEEIGKEQFSDAWRQAAERTPGGPTIDWIEQTVMPDGRAVTTRAETFESPPKVPPRPPRKKRGKNAKKKR
jgi:hypothetical protein